jgi:hypothetical protein
MIDVCDMALADAVDLLQSKKETLERLAERRVSKQVKAYKKLDNVDERLRYVKAEEDNLSQFWRDVELNHAIAELEDVAKMLGVALAVNSTG